MEGFENIPEIFKDEVFVQAFEKAEIAKYTEQERLDYEQSLKIYRDLKGVIDTAFDEGKQEGLLEGTLKGKLEVARKVKNKGLSSSEIADLTGLSENEIDTL